MKHSQTIYSVNLTFPMKSDIEPVKIVGRDLICSWKLIDFIAKHLLNEREMWGRIVNRILVKVIWSSGLGEDRKRERERESKWIWKHQAGHQPPTEWG